MNNFHCLIVLISLLNFSNSIFSAVLKSPNSDDQSYWRNYAENQLKKILARQGNVGDVAKNCIIFVGDGMGTPTITAGRIYKGQLNGLAGEETKLVFEDFANLGMAKTYNTNKQVPDSAGTATALFTGVKTKYQTVGLDSSASENSDLNDRLGSIIDWAQAANKRTGIVTTTRITHATPAATYSYSFDRNLECDTKVPEHLKSKFKDIAIQLVEDAPGKNLNVIMGGGRQYLGATKAVNYTRIQFPGNTEIPCTRTDNRNLVEHWLKSKTNTAYVTNTKELLSVDTDKTDHLMGLFADNHMIYDIARNKDPEGEPSLTQMTKAAIKILNNKNNDNGFVLMVESGRIDMAHHQNLGRAALHDFVEFERAIEMAVEALKGTDTLIIVTADHSHAFQFNGYGNRGNDIFGFANKPKDVTYEALTYSTGPGFFKHRSEKFNETWIPIESMTKEERSHPLYTQLAALPMKDAAHGGEDVPVFATGKGSGLIQGVFEQNYIPYVISFSTCIGPAAHLNIQCSKQMGLTGSSSILNLNLTLLLISLIFLILR